MRKKNVYTKSMLRKPLHSLILVFLLFIATFGFVLRSVEYLTVRDQIFSISNYYQSIGFLNGDNEFYDVSKGADFLENNRYIEMADQRRGVEAVLQQEMLNAEVDWRNFVWMDLDGAQINFLEHDEIFRRDAFFYAELIEKMEYSTDAFYPTSAWRLILAVDEVLVGYPEHVVAGQVKLQMDFSLEESDASAIANMEIGERYLLRGAFNPVAPTCVDYLDTNPMQAISPWTPTVGSERNVLRMRPLNQNGLWYVHVPYREMVDLMMPELEHVLEEIEISHHNQRTIQLRTTQDMALIPFVLEDAEMEFVVEGRPIDQEDYLNANPVAVVNHRFAHMRDLNIGDMITISIPQVHHADNGIVVYDRSFASVLDPFYEFFVESVSQGEGAHEIELEIVGIYNFFRQARGGTVFSNNGDIYYALSTFIYIPDSVLPEDVTIISERWGNSDAQTYLPSPWYSFMLRSSRYEEAFVAEVRASLEGMGLTLTMIDSGSENFWESANLILQSITFNGIVFSVVLILVLLLVTFLFLRQRRKELAVSRLLGYSISRSIKEVLATAILFLIPIMIGSILAWLFARHTMGNTLQNIEEFRRVETTAVEMDAVERFEALSAGYELSELLEVYETSEVVFPLSLYWLVALITIVFVLMMLMVFIGAIQMTYRPVLELLQRKR